MINSVQLLFLNTVLSSMQESFSKTMNLDLEEAGFPLAPKTVSPCVHNPAGSQCLPTHFKGRIQFISWEFGDLLQSKFIPKKVRPAVLNTV